MADYEDLVKSYIAEMSGLKRHKIDLSRQLESYLPSTDQKHVLFFLKRTVEHKRPRDASVERWLIVEPTTSGHDLLHYVSYLAGDPDYPRPKKNK